MARVNLGRIRTVFKGEWAAAAYEVDDVVLYAGSAYTCIAVAASGNDPTDTAFWIKSAGGIEFTGAWDTAVTYRVDQMVTFNGSTYIAITAHSATQPTATGQTDWDVFSGGFKFEGTWDVATAYETNDVATFSGSTYIARVDHTGVQPIIGGNASWAVFAGGFKFEGAWDTSTSYHLNDIVTFNRSTYISLTVHSGTQPTATGQTDWDVFSGGFKFEGTWDTSTAYHVNDIVTFNGSSFIAVSDHTGTQPAAAGNAGWELFASGGDIAAQTGNADKFLTTDGTGTSWGTVDSTFIDWSILTANTNAVSGAAYIINTTSAAFSLTLPSSPSDNDYILINDGFGKFSTNSLTIVRSGNNISGLAEDLVCDVNYSSFRLTFKTSNGWFLT
jgi:hypothetical protein